MSEALQAKEKFLQTKDRLAATFKAMPEDRASWSPSPTSRTAVEIVVHCANSIGRLHRAMMGQPLNLPTTAFADAQFREEEREVGTRDRALELLEENAQAYAAWLDAATPEHLASIFEAPFGLGQLPVTVAMHFPEDHTRSHIPQLEYIQTIYGDRDWRL